MANKTYKTPLIVKDVYIPFSEDDDGITLEQYKDKYGIDLTEHFDFKDDSNSFYPKPSFNKYYLVTIRTSGDYWDNRVIPLLQVDNGSGVTSISLFFESDANGTMYVSYTIQYHYTTKTLHINEI